jgi:hypothetical protein
MGEATRDPDEIEERIADILGYCRSDGELHDPRDFVEKYAGMRWQCPDCDLTISKVSYKRASDLQWVITPHSPPTEGGSVEFDEMDDSGLDDEKATLLDNVQELQERLFSDEDIGSDPSEQVESLSTGNSVSNSADSGSDSETDTESDPTPTTDEER